MRERSTLEVFERLRREAARRARGRARSQLEGRNEMNARHIYSGSMTLPEIDAALAAPEPVVGAWRRRRDLLELRGRREAEVAEARACLESHRQPGGTLDDAAWRSRDAGAAYRKVLRITGHKPHEAPRAPEESR